MIYENPREDARIRAGYDSTKDLSRLLNISEEYFKRLERKGDVPYLLAKRLATLYGCSMRIFL